MRPILIAAIAVLLTANVYAAAPTEGTLLVYKDAVVTGNPHVVKMVIAHGGIDNPLNGQFFEEGKTALMIAAENGHKKLVKYFLKSGANPSVVDDNGKTALTYAVENNHRSIARRLTSAENRQNR